MKNKQGANGLHRPMFFMPRWTTNPCIRYQVRDARGARDLLLYRRIKLLRMARENYSYSGSHCLVSQLRAIHTCHIVKKSCRKPLAGCFLRYQRYTTVRVAAYFSQPMQWSLLRISVHRKNYSLSRLLCAWVWPINWELPQNPNKCYGTPSCHFAAFLWVKFQFFDYL